MKKTLVLGASDKAERYSNKAIRMLLAHQVEVVAIGNKKTEAYQIPIETEQIYYTDIHTVTLYLNPTHQKAYYSYILSLKPKRIIFNPGTENPELEQLAKAQGIAVLEACTLVLLSTGQY